MKMRLGSWRLAAALAIGMIASPAFAQDYVVSTPAPAAQAQSVVANQAAPQAVAPAGTGVYEMAAAACNSCNDGPVSSCGAAGSRCDGDAWKLFGSACDDPWVTIGGWVSAGYHSDSNGLFNNHASDFNVHQTWLFAERVAESKDGRLGFGFRFDGMYGIDAPETQAFGNPGATWDLNPSFTRNAGFGWAIPQLYGEVAAGDWSVKIGHFYTILGYEVVTAPDNFFYSHAMTMFNSEPFTHTGVLASRAMGDDTTIYGGWTAGWDSGFDFSAGSNFIGGISTQIDPDVNLAYMTTFGNFGSRSAGNDDGYSHSIVLDMNMSENWNTVIQSDMTRIESTGEDSFGLMMYNFYTINSCISVGSRTEWWKGDDIIGYNYGGLSAAPVSSTSYYSSTYGVNFRVNPNIVLRPEYRYDWSPALDYDEAYFGFDVVATF